MVRKRRVSKKIFNGRGEDLIPSRYPFFEFLQKYRLYLIIGTVFVLLFMAGFYGWKYQSTKKEEKASWLFYQAHTVFQGSDDDEKKSEEALQLFQSLAHDYSGTSAGLLSLFYAGNCQFTLKRFDDAIASYGKFLGEVPPETQLELLAYDSLGYCYEEKKDFKKAIEYFQKTIAPAPGLGGNGYLNIARCFEAERDTENSLQFYKKFLSEYPDSERKYFVREKIRELESKT